MTKNKLKVKEGRTEFIVPHKDREISFIDTDRGFERYNVLLNKLSKERLSVPTMSEAVSFLDAVFNDSKNKWSKKILSKVDEYGIWTSTGARYIPEKGIFIQDNPQYNKRDLFLDGGGWGVRYTPNLDWIKMNMDELEKDLSSKEEDILYSEDRTIRFVPGREYDEHDEGQKEKLVVALVGTEGAEKIKSICDKCSENEIYLSMQGLPESWDQIKKYSELYSDFSHPDIKHGYFQSNEEGYHAQLEDLVIPRLSKIWFNSGHPRTGNFKYVAIDAQSTPHNYNNAFTFGVDRKQH